MTATPSSAPAFVMFGATGDLAMRMLFPSLWWLAADGLLDGDLRIVGLGRTDLDDEAFRALVAEALAPHTEDFDERARTAFLQRITYLPMNARDTAEYEKLAGHLGAPRETSFYLSVSPALYGEICGNLKAAGLATETSRILIEKPLGRDLPSCQTINDCMALSFSEDRTFRVDHYLGKETVQNLLALRFANAIFEPLWNAQAIDHVQITAAETVGVEGRWSYYDDYGAIRDMVQNHLMQLLCLLAMEPPAALDPDSVRNEKVKVLRSLRPITPDTVERNTARGQYAQGVSGNSAVTGYLSEDGAGPSDTETFVALRAHLDNWRWAGVPFYLRTGKRMPARKTQIVIQFREIPHSVFTQSAIAPNRLVIDLQPVEEITLFLMNGTPGLTGGEMMLRSQPLSLSLTHAFKEERPRRRIAYERLLFDALNGRSTLFVRRDEAEEAWRWIDGIVDSWHARGMRPKPYAAGTAGTPGSVAMIERDGRSWYE